MAQVLSRLANPPGEVWLALAVVGLLASVLTLAVMRWQIKQHPAVMRSAMVASMKQHDIRAEFVRLGAYSLALLAVIGVVFDFLPSMTVVVCLIGLLACHVVNSVNELRTTVRLLGGWPFRWPFRRNKDASRS